MKLFNNRLSRPAILGGVGYTAIATQLTNQSESIFQEEVSKLMLGNESYRSAHPSINLDSTFESVRTLMATLGNESAAGSAIPATVIAAGARTAMIYGNPIELKKVAKEALGNESFHPASDFTTSRNYAVALAMVDAEGRNGSAINAIFPTVDLNADYVTATLELPRYEVVGNSHHKGDGAEITDFGRFHLASGARKTGILSGNHNRMYPAVVTGSNENLLIPSAKVPFGTAPHADWKTGSIGNVPSLNLMTLCRAPGMPAQDSANYNDRIDFGGRIENIYVNLADDAVHKVSVRHLSESIFGVTQQGSSRTGTVAAINGLLTRVSVVGHANAKLAAIATAGAKEIEIQIQLNQRLDVHTGSLIQTHSATLVGLYAELGGNVNLLGDSAFTTAVAALDIEFLGSDLDLRWSSRTVRLDGLRVDVRVIPKSYPMQARRPITADREVNTENVDDIISAMNMARSLSRESDGFKYLNEEITRLAAMYGTDGKVKLDAENTQYAGAYYINQAWVKDVPSIDLADLVIRDKSSDIQDDIGAAIVSLLANEFTDMVVKSGMSSVVNEYAKGSKLVPTITGPASLLRYIRSKGESFTFGSETGNIGVVPVLAPTDLDIMDDTLIMVPQLDGGNTEANNVFGFGFCLECPPLVYDLTTKVDGGGEARILRMTPFYDFVINTPVAYRVKITKVAEFLASQGV